MPTPCPSCGKLCSLDTQEPEVNEISLSEDGQNVTYDIRVARNSACCGDEMKEYTFNNDVEVPDDIRKQIEALLETNPEAEVEVEEDGFDVLEEGGSRYQKSYYGFSGSIKFVSYTPGPGLTDEEAAELKELTPNTKKNEQEYARMRELFAKTKPIPHELGIMEVSDKVAASDFEELN